MKIKVDNREPTLIKLLNALKTDYKYDFEIVVEKLDLGDIIICKDDEELLIIERKSLNDLASSLRDGRYKEQSYRLTGLPIHNHNIVYLVEGNVSFYSSKYFRRDYYSNINWWQDISTGGFARRPDPSYLLGNNCSLFHYKRRTSND